MPETPDRLAGARGAIRHALVTANPNVLPRLEDVAGWVVEQLTAAGWYLTNIGDAVFEDVPWRDLKVDDLFLIHGDYPLQVTYAQVLNDAAPDGTVRYRAGGFPGALTLTPNDPDSVATVLRGPFLTDDDIDELDAAHGIEPVEERPADPRVVLGARCAWWGLIGDTSTTGSGLPCCPHCGSPLFEIESLEVWWAQVDEFERTTEPGYRGFIEWLRSKHFRTLDDARHAYQVEKAQQ